ncbi:MAG: M23 family metallopeptidase, partial [Peptococcaceae bacterium]|nr:M23 family metallopeptidase [Peptococcaceae bacterium]
REIQPMIRSIKRVANQASKKLAKAALKKAVAALAPLFITFLPVILAILAAIVLFAAVYGSMPHEQSLTGVLPASQDAAIRNNVDKEVAKNNVKETWLVKDEGVFHLGYLADRYGSDRKIINKWGDAYAPALYKAMQTPGIDNLSNEGWVNTEIEKLAGDLRPFFYYKESTVTICGKDGCDRYIVYLLTEANTIRGHYRYTYEWVTKTGGGGSITYEQLKDTILIGPKWERLENYLMEYLNVPEGENATLARQMVFEAGEGFTARKEWLDWLNGAFGSVAAWASGAMVPAELRQYFEEAGQRFGIPWWFLAAVAMKESGFTPTATGSDGTGSYGIMQVLPENWKKYAPLLGFYPVADRDNPRAQIMVGAYMLASYGVHVNWDSHDWKEESLPMLVAYNAGPGYVGNPGMTEYVRRNYAEQVWAYAEKFKAPAVWPVPGYTEITSGFGIRIDPFSGKPKMHNGIDIAAPTGATVVSISGGIAYVGYEPNGFGNYVVIKDATYEYYYAHLSSVTVVSGQTVTPGTKIGEVGSTGASTGPHLHFGVMPLDSGQWIDPLLVLGT